MTRAALADIVAIPSEPPNVIAVKPNNPHSALSRLQQGRGRYVPGRDKPLTSNPPHPFIKQVDDELVLPDASSRAQLNT